jgi:hypothetical protein
VVLAQPGVVVSEVLGGDDQVQVLGVELLPRDARELRVPERPQQSEA